MDMKIHIGWVNLSLNVMYNDGKINVKVARRLAACPYLCQHLFLTFT